MNKITDVSINEIVPVNVFCLVYFFLCKFISDYITNKLTDKKKSIEDKFFYRTIIIRDSINKYFFFFDKINV
jgi:hypothetical protein